MIWSTEPYSSQRFCYPNNKEFNKSEASERVQYPQGVFNDNYEYYNQKN